MGNWIEYVLDLWVNSFLTHWRVSGWFDRGLALWGLFALGYAAWWFVGPWVVRALTLCLKLYRWYRHRMYRARLEFKKARRDTPRYSKLTPTWRYRLAYHWQKRRNITLPNISITVPDVKIDKKLALRMRREWNRMRDTVAPIVLARDEWHCQWCDLSLDEYTWSIDHIIPISRGGTNELHNLQAMCRSCNSTKGDKVDTWGKFWDKVAA